MSENLKRHKTGYGYRRFKKKSRPESFILITKQSQIASLKHLAQLIPKLFQPFTQMQKLHRRGKRRVIFIILIVYG